MITILSAVFSILGFRLRRRASLELELIALRHQVSVLRRQRPCRLRLFSTDLSMLKTPKSEMSGKPRDLGVAALPSWAFVAAPPSNLSSSPFDIKSPRCDGSAQVGFGFSPQTGYSGFGRGP
jgi:hypothetical protein